MMLFYNLFTITASNTLVKTHTLPRHTGTDTDTDKSTNIHIHISAHCKKMPQPPLVPKAEIIQFPILLQP